MEIMPGIYDNVSGRVDFGKRLVDLNCTSIYTKRT